LRKLDILPDFCLTLRRLVLECMSCACTCFANHPFSRTDLFLLIFLQSSHDNSSWTLDTKCVPSCAAWDTGPTTLTPAVDCPCSLPIATKSTAKWMVWKYCSTTVPTMLDSAKYYNISRGAPRSIRPPCLFMPHGKL
jgi:hypothetical protein